jgi:hypothetical protein
LPAISAQRARPPYAAVSAISSPRAKPPQRKDGSDGGRSVNLHVTTSRFDDVSMRQLVVPAPAPSRRPVRVHDVPVHGAVERRILVGCDPHGSLAFLVLGSLDRDDLAALLRPNHALDPAEPLLANRLQPPLNEAVEVVTCSRRGTSCPISCSLWGPRRRPRSTSRKLRRPVRVGDLPVERHRHDCDNLAHHLVLLRSRGGSRAFLRDSAGTHKSSVNPWGQRADGACGARWAWNCLRPATQRGRSLSLARELVGDKDNSLVENKIAEAHATQALQLNTTGALASIDGNEAVVVLWRDLLERPHRAPGAPSCRRDRRRVVDHFLTYVEDHFAALGPFRTLRLWHGTRLVDQRGLRTR